jgi:homocysteine S-methyltransferase
LIEEKVGRRKVNLVEKYQSLGRPLILDGAMGSLLQQRNVLIDKNLWSSLANITNSAQVTRVYSEYMEAGAEIITTNTFRTNPYAFKHSNLNITHEEFVKHSVKLLADVIGDKEIIIAGSNAPAEDCYQEERTIPMYDLEYNHKIHIEQLWENDCDIIWNETQSHWDELNIICKFCEENSITFAVSLYFTDDLRLLSGEYLHDAVQFVKDYSPAAIGFNCIKPEALEDYLHQNSLPDQWGFYFNCGSGNIIDKTISCGINPDEYTTEIRPFLNHKPIYAGSCCGSSPAHTKAIKDLFNELY